MGKGQWRLIPGAFGVLCCAAVVVCALSETSVINEFAAGIVDIEIRDSGTGEKQRILPGQKLGGSYRIQNNGNDCFVRARFTLRGVRARVVDCITGMDDMWMEGDDGYYYCREVLKEGAFVNLIDGMKIPETLSQAPEGGLFSWMWRWKPCRARISARIFTQFHLGVKCKSYKMKKTEAFRALHRQRTGLF